VKIHRLVLRNYRGVTECEVAFAADGVTIVEGPNEVGKSSLAEAVELLFDERDDTGKQRVREIKPVDRDAGAEVEADSALGVEHGSWLHGHHHRNQHLCPPFVPRPAQIKLRWPLDAASQFSGHVRGRQWGRTIEPSAQLEARGVLGEQGHPAKTDDRPHGRHRSRPALRPFLVVPSQAKRRIDEGLLAPAPHHAPAPRSNRDRAHDPGAHSPDGVDLGTRELQEPLVAPLLECGQRPVDLLGGTVAG
jgi:hypothetical protein